MIIEITDICWLLICWDNSFNVFHAEIRKGLGGEGFARFHVCWYSAGAIGLENRMLGKDCACAIGVQICGGRGKERGRSLGRIDRADSWKDFGSWSEGFLYGTFVGWEFESGLDWQEEVNVDYELNNWWNTPDVRWVQLS